MTIDFANIAMLNLTLHPATSEQLEEGVIDCRPSTREELIEELTFNDLPNRWEVSRRIERIVELANHEFSYYKHAFRKANPKESCPLLTGYVMIGGAPFLMHDLEDKLREAGYIIRYAFSKRQSVEFTTAAGVVKKSVFLHAGFVHA